MKLFKGNFGWSTTAHSKTKDGKELKHYFDVSFAKVCEPETNELDGDLIFRTKDGKEYSCFFSSFEKKGLIEAKMVMMPVKEVQTPLTRDDGRDMFGRKQEVKIDTDALPFY